MVACSGGGLGSFTGTAVSGAKGERWFWRFGFTGYFAIEVTCGTKSEPAVFLFEGDFGVWIRGDFHGRNPDSSGVLEGLSNRLCKMGKLRKWSGHCICCCLYFFVCVLLLFLRVSLSHPRFGI